MRDGLWFVISGLWFDDGTHRRALGCAHEALFFLWGGSDGAIDFPRFDEIGSGCPLTED